MVRAPRSHPGSSCRTARLLFPSGRRRATLREQVALLKRKRPRPVLNPLDRFFSGLPSAAAGPAGPVSVTASGSTSTDAAALCALGHLDRYTCDWRVFL